MTDTPIDNTDNQPDANYDAGSDDVLLNMLADEIRSFVQDTNAQTVAEVKTYIDAALANHSLAQSTNHVQMIQAMNALSAAVLAPKRLTFDESGKPAGIETVLK